MFTPPYNVDALPPLIQLGRQTEHEAEVIEFDISAWLAKWPGMTCQVCPTLPGERRFYLAPCTQEGSILRWTVSRVDTSRPGTGRVEIRGLLGGVRKMSAFAYTNIEPTHATHPHETPEQYGPWVDQVLEAAAGVRKDAEAVAASLTEIPAIKQRLTATENKYIELNNWTASADIRFGNYADAIEGIYAELTEVYDQIGSVPVFVDHDEHAVWLGGYESGTDTPFGKVYIGHSAGVYAINLLEEAPSEIDSYRLMTASEVAVFVAEASAALTERVSDLEGGYAYLNKYGNIRDRLDNHADAIETLQRELDSVVGYVGVGQGPSGDEELLLLGGERAHIFNETGEVLVSRPADDGLVTEKLATEGYVGKQIAALSEEMADLKENGAGVAVDETLTQSGMAADAAVTGQKIAELDSAAFVLSAGKNLFNPATAEVGAIQPDGSVSTAGAYAGYSTSDYIEVEQQTDYTATIVAYDATGAVTGRKFILLFDDQKNVVSGTHQNVNNASLTFNTGNAHYVRMSGYVGSGEYPYKLQLEKGTLFTGYEAYTAGVRKLREPYPDILREKKWVVISDSFTQGGYRETDGFDESAYKFQSGKYAGNNITYPYIIAERTNLEIISFFNGGRTLANPADGSFTNSITNPNCAAYYQNVPEDADYITIYLGINDSHHESGTSGTDGEDVTGVIPLGTIDDTDATTFCGAWNVVLPWLMTNRPNAHIGIIVSNGVDRVEYRTATIAAAKKWGIPYLDLNGDERCPAMIRTVNPDISDAAKDILKQKWGVTASNLHPNTAAHYFQSTFIENWLRTL
jgi:hypothetical protein